MRTLLEPLRGRLDRFGVNTNSGEVLDSRIAVIAPRCKRVESNRRRRPTIRFEAHLPRSVHRSYLRLRNLGQTVRSLPRRLAEHHEDRTPRLKVQRNSGASVRDLVGHWLRFT